MSQFDNTHPLYYYIHTPISPSIEYSSSTLEVNFSNSLLGKISKINIKKIRTFEKLNKKEKIVFSE